MPISAHRGIGSVWFEMTKPGGGTDFPILTIWDDGEVILEASTVNHEYIYPTLEEWEFLAKVVATNIERLRKDERYDSQAD